jgi:hypothetical protein
VNLSEIPVNQNQIQGRTLVNSYVTALALAKQKHQVAFVTDNMSARLILSLAESNRRVEETRDSADHSLGRPVVPIRRHATQQRWPPRGEECGVAIARDAHVQFVQVCEWQAHTRRLRPSCVPLPVCFLQKQLSHQGVSTTVDIINI